MSKPANPVSWATDANYATGADTGLSTRLEPSAGVKAQGFIPAEEVPARWVNWTIGALADWTTYVDNLPTDTDFVDSAFTWGGVHTFNGNATFAATVTFTGFQHLSAGYVENNWGVFGETLYVNAAGVVTPATRSMVLPFTSGQALDPSRAALMVDRVRFTNTTVWVQPIELPRGVILTDVTMAFKNNSGSTTTALIYYLRKYTPDFATAGAATVTTLDTLAPPAVTAGSVWISGLTAPISHTIDNSTGYYVLEFTSDVGDLMGIKVTFTDPGPRNG